MVDGLEFHHIGYVTDSIDATSLIYDKFGYFTGNQMIDPIQKVKVCFLYKAHFPTIELIEPLTPASSVNKILAGSGVTPYHVCYEVLDIYVAFEILESLGFIPLFRPVEAKALNNRLICYFYRKDFGYLEILQKE